MEAAISIVVAAIDGGFLRLSGIILSANSPRSGDDGSELSRDALSAMTNKL